MITTSSWPGRAALMVAHCAGMVDLVALPLWVGTLIGQYGFDPQQAGGLATLFLAAAVLASVTLAPRFGRLPRRAVVAVGFAVAGLAFFGASLRQDFAALALLHALAGLAAGAALSVTHGTIARSANPHRLFAVVGIALGVFAIAFFAVVPPLLAAVGGVALFRVFAAVMAVAAFVALFAFPQADAAPAGDSTAPAPAAAAPMPRAVWFGIVGIACMGLVQAMTFAFLERVGSDRGFGPAAVAGVLVALSLVNLLPAALAALLEKRWSARAVLLSGPVLQALLVALIMQSTVFAPYAAAASVFAAVMIFTHTFGFGLLARLDASGRALAATPAMLMTGAAIGPILGGTLVKAFGYGSLAVAAAAIAALAVACFSRLPAPAGAPARSVLA
ncbi:MAG: MFS transporter [Piscinibacter sp.]|uniref:MFS transporter n=1 Tax=Piscinibacter TaxID=1114981 RepID=UPI000FDDAA11|nr:MULTISPECIES: MFS transporter [Piscinibacter]MCW5667537.1 MFS transporter [Piscinibacter sp.]